MSLRTNRKDFESMQYDLFDDKYVCRHCGLVVMCDNDDEPEDVHQYCSTKDLLSDDDFNEDDY